MAGLEQVDCILDLAKASSRCIGLGALNSRFRALDNTEVSRALSVRDPNVSVLRAWRVRLRAHGVKLGLPFVCLHVRGLSCSCLAVRVKPKWILPAANLGLIDVVGYLDAHFNIEKSSQICRLSMGNCKYLLNFV